MRYNIHLMDHPLSFTSEKLHINMRQRATPTRLEIHRLKYNQGGRRGNLLEMKYLEESEKDILQKEILQDMRVKRLDFTGDMDEQVFDQVQMEVFAEYGVMCPHTNLLKDRKLSALICSVCGCHVIGISQERMIAADE